MTIASTFKKYASIQGIRILVTETVHRFPAPLLITISGSVVWTIVLEQEIHSDNLIRVLWTLAVALPLFIALAVITESDRWSRAQVLMWHGIALIGCVGFFWGLPANMDFVPFADVIRSLLLGGAAILLLLSAGIVAHKQQEHDFWQYAVRIFSNVILSGALGGALFAGLAAALSTIDFLFDVNVPDERFGEAGIFAIGIFAMSFFLARFPSVAQIATKKEISDQQNAHTTFSEKSSLMYRKEFTLLAQYVLLPLVTLYFIIMYVYGFKIVLTQEWPDGSVSNFIIAFAIVGIFAYMLLYPRLAEKRWLRIFGTTFYATLLPLIGLLFWAITLRIQQYAWTERRYLTVVFGVWLIAACVYFLVNKRKDIRLVPVSLAIILLLTSVGPWGAINISRISQTHRLLEIAERNQLVTEGHLIAAADKQDISFDDRKELSAIMQYLYERHGLSVLEKIMNKDLSKYVDTNEYYYDVARQVITYELNFPYVEQYERISPEDIDTKNGSRYYSARAYVHDFQAEAIPIADYDYMIDIQPFDIKMTDTSTNTFTMNENEYTLALNMTSNQLSITNVTTQETVTFDLTEQLATIFTTYPENQPTLPRETLHFTPEPNATANFTADLYIEELGFEIKDSQPTLNSIYGQLFISFN